MSEGYRMDRGVQRNPGFSFDEDRAEVPSISLTADPVVMCTGASGSM